MFLKKKYSLQLKQEPVMLKISLMYSIQLLYI